MKQSVSLGTRKNCVATKEANPWHVKFPADTPAGPHVIQWKFKALNKGKVEYYENCADVIVGEKGASKTKGAGKTKGAAKGPKGAKSPAASDDTTAAKKSKGKKPRKKKTAKDGKKHQKSKKKHATTPPAESE